MHDLKKIPDLAALESLLQSAPFRVRRSNGAVETGWKLDYGSRMESQFIIYSSTVNQWMIPVVSGDEESFKHILMSEITDPELFDQSVFAGPVATAIRALDRGVYIEDSERASQLPSNVEGAEIPGFSDIICEDGRRCRVFVG